MLVGHFDANLRIGLPVPEVELMRHDAHAGLQLLEEPWPQLVQDGRIQIDPGARSLYRYRVVNRSSARNCTRSLTARRAASRRASLTRAWHDLDAETSRAALLRGRDHDAAVAEPRSITKSSGPTFPMSSIACTTFIGVGIVWHVLPLRQSIFLRVRRLADRENARSAEDRQAEPQDERVRARLRMRR